MLKTILQTRFLAVLILLFMTFIAGVAAPLPNGKSYISSTPGLGHFPLSTSGHSAPLFLSNNDYPGVIRVAKLLQTDIEHVSGVKPGLALDQAPGSTKVVIIGTAGKSPIIKKLVQAKKLNLAEIAGRWETYVIETVENPLPGVERALVIVGSDKRGTIYGMFDLSAQIGVSPWYWWADVPVRKQSNLFVAPGRHTDGTPKVKYRGIFINDEAPALAGWAEEKFGGFNHQFYEKVFELILRLKGNYLWPAMWGRSIYDDDPASPPLADEYGVVIGMSHHEPMMRAHVEWSRYGHGPWNYDTNPDTLRAFWREGIERMGANESIVTIGMRGDGDEPMSEESNIALLERIVADQRQILEEVTGKPAAETPQIWALYKEVQEYYDKGMRVPKDVTLLLCDDNWGNIRKLPKLDSLPRPGGYGIYYHYDYVGGPRNYKWLNTNQISRVWEQMHLAYEYGADRIWIVNVGDIKPMEFPIQFFLDYAWDPNRWPAERLPEYTGSWAAQQFGATYAADIADLLEKYTKYNSRRKPELLSPETYSLVNFREAETVVADYNKLAERAEQIKALLPAEYHDAYYQLVLHPIKACANLNELYVTAAQNRLYAKQGRTRTNELAGKVKALFERDAEFSRYYNEMLANGKWSHMMDQTHIGYTYWQQPEQNNMPEVRNIEAPAEAQMGVAVESSQRWWPEDTSKAVLPEFSPFRKQAPYFEIFNRGQKPFKYTIQTDAKWLRITPEVGQLETEKRHFIEVDWQKAPAGKQLVPISISGPNNVHVQLQLPVTNPPVKQIELIDGFVEANGYVSMEAAHFTRAVDLPPIRWQKIPNLGRTASAMTTMPVTKASQSPGGDSSHLEYKIHLFSAGEIKVRAYFSPTLNFHNTDGLRYGISIDDESPQVVNIHSRNSWGKWVSENVITTTSTHKVSEPGEHVLKFWRVDPGVVLQKLVAEAAEIPASYLGPPESVFLKK